MAKTLPTLRLIFLLTVLVTAFHASESQDDFEIGLEINSREIRSYDVGSSNGGSSTSSSSSSTSSSSSSTSESSDSNSGGVGKCGRGKGKGQGKGKGKGPPRDGFLGDCCENDADCNGQLALQCINNTCQCLPGHVNISGTCTLLSCIGEPCNITDQCKGENVVCDEELDICLCSNGFLLTQDGQCVNRSSELCDSCTNDPDSCAPDFQCGESGLCECPDELPIQIGYQCYGRFYNESCNTAIPTCIEPFMECNIITNVCDCQSGYSWNGSFCVGSQLCEICDNAPDSCGMGLVCGVSGRCECTAPLSVQIGGECYGRFYNESCNIGVPTCIENFMECSVTTGLCDCEDPYVWNGSLCVGGNLGDPCDPTLGLCAANGFVCGDSYQCQCPDDEVQVGDQCFSLLCGDCVMDNDCLGANQICVNNNCECQSGFYTDSCGVCQAKLQDDSDCTADVECLSNTCLCDLCVPADSEDCCDDCSDFVADLITIIDNSGSVGSVNYETEKAFVITLANAFDISSLSARIGFIDYSSGVNTAINMNDPNFDTNLEVTRRICQHPYIGGATRTDLALQQAITFLQSSENRPNVNNYVILLTDGGTNAGGENFIDSVAAQLKAIPDTEVFVVGIGFNINATQLNVIASDPANVYSATFSSLGALTETILEDICANS